MSYAHICWFGVALASGLRAKRFRTNHCAGREPRQTTPATDLGCRRQLNTGSGTVSVRSVGEQNAAAEQVGVRASVHLAFEHFDAVDVSFHAAGAPLES